MAFGRIDHSFDWRGFSFVFKVIVAFVIVITGGHYGLTYAESYFAPTTLSETVAVQSEPLIPIAEAATLSSSTPQRVINALTIADTIPKKGKFIAADLVHMNLSLYQDGIEVAEYPILTKGKPGSPYETPSGAYNVLTKEQDHFNRKEKVHMPYSMEFYGNYFIHGWPTYTDGTPVASTYSGGCIRLSTDDAADVYSFADKGTGIFVYDTGSANPQLPLLLGGTYLPTISASSYLVADIDTGDVYAERDAGAKRPIASVTNLMTALVANETIMFDRPITVPEGKLQDTAVATDTVPKTFVVGDLLYPLLMESNNNIADALAQYYGARGFVSWMNSQAKALDMTSTTFADASGVSPEDVSTPEDLYRLAVYLTNKKSFVWKITRTPQKKITADDGSNFTYANFNVFSDLGSFVGGKVGHTTPAQDTMVSVFSIPVGSVNRRIAIIVLDSSDYAADTRALASWFTTSTKAAAGPACVSCAEPHYRQIEL